MAETRTAEYRRRLCALLLDMAEDKTINPNQRLDAVREFGKLQASLTAKAKHKDREPEPFDPPFEPEPAKPTPIPVLGTR